MDPGSIAAGTASTRRQCLGGCLHERSKLIWFSLFWDGFCTASPPKEYDMLGPPRDMAVAQKVQVKGIVIHPFVRVRFSTIYDSPVEDSAQFTIRLYKIQHSDHQLLYNVEPTHQGPLRTQKYFLCPPMAPVPLPGRFVPDAETARNYKFLDTF